MSERIGLEQLKRLRSYSRQPSWAEEFERLSGYSWARFEIEGLPGPLYACFGETTAGQPVVTGLLLSPETNQEVRARTLREIPLNLLLMVQPYLFREWMASAGWPTPEPRAGGYLPPQVKPGPKGWPREHFEQVADAYRQAQRSHPQAPIKALARQLHRSEPTVHRWLQRCRDMGLLPRQANGDEPATPPE